MHDVEGGPVLRRAAPSAPSLFGLSASRRARRVRLRRSLGLSLSRDPSSPDPSLPEPPPCDVVRPVATCDDCVPDGRCFDAPPVKVRARTRNPGAPPDGAPRRTYRYWASPRHRAGNHMPWMHARRARAALKANPHCSNPFTGHPPHEQDNPAAAPSTLRSDASANSFSDLSLGRRRSASPVASFILTMAALDNIVFATAGSQSPTQGVR